MSDTLRIDGPKCPACGSQATKWRVERSGRRLHTEGIRVVWICRDCGTAWSDVSDTDLASPERK